MTAPKGMDRDLGDWDDARLVEASYAGDQAAWAELYGRHFEYTRTVAARRNVDPASIESALAAGWGLAFRRLDELGDPAKFRPWVAGAVAHAVDELQRFEPVAPSDAVTAPTEVVRSGPIGAGAEVGLVAGAGMALADRASRADFARRAFQALPGRHGQVLALALVDDMPVKQIAATFDLDPNAVSRLFDRAKNDLRHFYERSRIPDSAPEECRRVHEKIIDYLRGVESLRSVIATHLAECDPCMARLAEGLSRPTGRLAPLGWLPRKTVTAVSGTFGSGLKGATNLSRPVAGAIAGGSAAVVTAAVVFGAGLVSLPGTMPPHSSSVSEVGPGPGGADAGHRGGASGAGPMIPSVRPMSSKAGSTSSVSARADNPLPNGVPRFRMSLPMDQGSPPGTSSTRGRLITSSTPQDTMASTVPPDPTATPSTTTAPAALATNTQPTPSTAATTVTTAPVTSTTVATSASTSTTSTTAATSTTTTMSTTSNPASSSTTANTAQTSLRGRFTTQAPPTTQAPAPSCPAWFGSWQPCTA